MQQGFCLFKFLALLFLHDHTGAECAGKKEWGRETQKGKRQEERKSALLFCGDS
jgi:hypothetical protein